MNILKKGLTIRWKIVLIYCLLVFIATTIIGVFIMSRLEDYHMANARNNMINTVSGALLTSLASYSDLKGNQAEIQANIDAWAKTTITDDIFVVDDGFTIIASNTANVGKSSFDILDSNIITKSLLSGENMESSGVIPGTSIPVMNLAIPIQSGGEVRGVVYMRTNITEISDTIDQSKFIFVNAMIIALVVTMVLGFLISRTITIPIQEVTQKAAKMAQGDFTQEVTVKSNDEIGQLAQMFNLLRIQLSETLAQIAGEKNKLETILRYMADGLIAIDLSGQIIHANQAAMRLLKILPEELSEKPYDVIIRDFKEDLALENLMEKCRDGAVAETFTGGGSTYAVRYDHFKDEGGRDIGIIMILQDITERQKMEDMQTDFVANVSHELKTPLTTIKSYTETLLAGALSEPETAKAFLEIIDTETDRMNRLVKELLQLSRLDYQQEKWYKKQTNLITLLKTSVTKMELTAKGKRQHLNLIFDPDQTIRVEVDKDGIEQVIQNILSNAIKYTREGGRIDIDALALESGKKAHIIIADNGIGIPESEVSRVFERFFRVDKARSRAMGGTGLGLAISKQIVEEHGGGIEIESREGRGTRVTIVLPLAPTRGKKGIE